MGAARDEGHVGAALGEARAEIAAYTARTHDRYAHRFRPFDGRQYHRPAVRAATSRDGVPCVRQ
jgi:hypothetical protein